MPLFDTGPPAWANHVGPSRRTLSLTMASPLPDSAGYHCRRADSHGSRASPFTTSLKRLRGYNPREPLRDRAHLAVPHRGAALPRRNPSKSGSLRERGFDPPAGPPAPAHAPPNVPSGPALEDAMPLRSSRIFQPLLLPRIERGSRTRADRHRGLPNTTRFPTNT